MHEEIDLLDVKSSWSKVWFYVLYQCSSSSFYRMYTRDVIIHINNFRSLH